MQVKTAGPVVVCMCVNSYMCSLLYQVEVETTKFKCYDKNVWHQGEGKQAKSQAEYTEVM